MGTEKIRWTSTYKKSQPAFWGWLVCLLFFGLLGVWMPIVKSIVNEAVIDWRNALLSGSVSTFCLATLVDGLLTAISHPKSRRIGPLLLAFGALLLFANGFWLYESASGTTTSTLEFVVLASLFLTIWLVVWLYKYRTIDLAESVATFVTNEDDQIREGTNVARNPIP